MNVYIYMHICVYILYMSIESIYCSFTPWENVDFFHLKSE